MTGFSSVCVFVAFSVDSLSVLAAGKDSEEGSQPKELFLKCLKSGQSSRHDEKRFTTTEEV
jgi:hypothetical protein